MTQFAAGGSLSLAGALIAGALGFLLTVLLTRGLPSVEETGAFLTAVALFNILVRVAQLGAGTGLIRFFSQRRALGRPEEIHGFLTVAIGPVLLLSLALSVGLYVGAEQLGEQFASAGAVASFASYLRAFAPFLTFATLLNLGLGATRGFGTMRPTVVLDNVTRPLGQVVAVGAALFASASPTWLGVGYWLPTAVVGVWVWRAVARRLPSRSLAARTRPWREFWAFSLPRAVAGVFAVLIQWIDTLMLGAMSTSASAGLYAAVTRYLVLGNAVQGAILQAFQPLITGVMAARDVVASRELFQTATAWSVLLTWPIYLTFAVHAETFLTAFGSAYVQGRWVMVVLAAAWLVGTALGPVDAVLVMAGRSSLSMFNLAVALTVNVVANLLLIPPLGALGAAIAWAGSILIHNLLPLSQVYVTMRLHPFGRSTLVSLAITSACFGVVGWVSRLLLGESLLATGGSLAISVVVYSACLVLGRERLELATLARTVRHRVAPHGGEER